MGFSHDINQKQQQKLILSAQMRESLNILQMPLTDLLRKVDEEIIENPILDFGESEEDEVIENLGNSEFKDLLKSAPNDWDEKEPVLDAGNFDPFLFVSKESTFSDFLLEQLRELKIDAQTATICRYLIEDLDEKGYLPENAETLAGILGVTDVRLVEDAIEVIHSMEPTGVGASNLQECLTLQLQRIPDSSPAEFEIVRKYLEFLANNKIRSIAKELKISASDAQKFCDRIRRLNPIPSSGFNTSKRDKFVLPEAIIQTDGSGHLTIEMNCSAAHRLSINPLYRKLAQTTDDKETQKYIKEKMARASLLIHEISERASTVSRILKKIVELQPSYFSKGIASLEPMTMKEIAKELDLNESTVSRAVQDKFILCSFGMVSIKSLFTAQLGNPVNGTVVSVAEVKKKIQKCIDTEDKKIPLSDQAIVSELRKQKITLSRRTVAKYRSELNIPVMAKRKVY